MKETINKCYCDILSEHNGQKVEGAKPYQNVSVMVSNDGDTPFITETSLDMCDACKAKYKTNLFLNYDYKGKKSFVFEAEQAGS